MVTRQRKTWKPDRDGKYSRQRGWTVNRRTDVRRQPKFYIGTDLKEATRRNGKLEEFWEHIKSLAAQGIIDSTWTPDGLWSRELEHLFESQRPPISLSRTDPASLS